MSPLRRSLRSRLASHVALAVVAFMLGGTTIVLAAGSGAVKLPSFQLADGTNPDQLAKVDASGNVAVSVANTPSVNIANTPAVTIGETPTVRVARQPFQQFVPVFSPGGGDFCEPIVIPSGMRLTIESFSANAFWFEKPSVYLRVDTMLGGVTTEVRSVALEMRQLYTNTWAGSVQTLLFTGGDLGPDPSRTYTVYACTLGIGVELRALVTGYLEPLG